MTKDSKPIGPSAHGAIDYGFMTLNTFAPRLYTFAPRLFGLKGTAKTLCYAFAGSQGLLNALTDHPLGVMRLVPLRIHWQLETPYVPALLVLPWVTGAFKQRKARLYFLSFFGIALANYLLTDYKAYERKQLTREGQA